MQCVIRPPGADARLPPELTPQPGGQPDGANAVPRTRSASTETHRFSGSCDISSDRGGAVGR